MATRIFRVDLSDLACDYQAAALEPGLPMLDRQNSNDAILHRWLGDLAAESHWEADDSVSFFVRHAQQGRLEDVACRPVVREDLQGPLQEDLNALRDRIKRARPHSSTERLLHQIVRQEFDRITADLDRGDFDGHFFKYRQEQQPWRLVWCWGYQRIDHEPATALICHNESCRLLFARRAGQGSRCPDCNSMVDRKRRRTLLGTLRANAAALLLLLLLAGLLAAWLAYQGRERPVAAPEMDDDVFHVAPNNVALTVYEEKELKIVSKYDVRVDAASSDPTVVEVQNGTRLIGRGEGTAEVTLTRNGVERIVKVTVTAPEIAGLQIVAGMPRSFTPHDPVLVDKPLDPVPVEKTPVLDPPPIVQWGPHVRVALDPDGPRIVRVAENSPFWHRGWREGMRPLRWNDRLLPLDPDFYVEHLPAPKDVFEWDPDAGQPVVTPSIPVLLTRWRPLDETTNGFRPQLHLALTERADYRILTADGTPLTDWATYGPNANATIAITTPIPRSTDGEYELIVQRRTTDGKTKQFPISFTLKPDGR